MGEDFFGRGNDAFPSDEAGECAGTPPDDAGNPDVTVFDLLGDVCDGEPVDGPN